MLIIAPKPIPLISLVANPFTGEVDMILSEEARLLFGPAYLGLVRQQMEKALKIIDYEEKHAYKDSR